MRWLFGDEEAIWVSSSSATPVDIGKRFLVCCVMTGAAHEEPRSETRRFDTTVPGLKRLRNWLNEERVTDVVMESTGSYWIPVFNLLENHVTVVLANPEEMKNRKGPILLNGGALRTA